MSSPCMKKDTVNTTHSTPADNDHVASLRLSLSNLTSQLLSTEKRLCTMSGKFNKAVDLLALRTARSYAMAASLAVSCVPRYVSLPPIVSFVVNFFPLLDTPLYPTVSRQLQ